MAKGRTPEQVQREIESEREQLAHAVDSVQSGLDMTDKLREKLPAVAGGALAAGFVLAGGIGATMRLVFRRGREGNTKARAGRFTLIDRD
jgi:hypothetical protein